MNWLVGFFYFFDFPLTNIQAISEWNDWFLFWFWFFVEWPCVEIETGRLLRVRYLRILGKKKLISVQCQIFAGCHFWVWTVVNNGNFLLILVISYTEYLIKMVLTTKSLQPEEYEIMQLIKLEWMQTDILVLWCDVILYRAEIRAGGKRTLIYDKMR